MRQLIHSSPYSSKEIHFQTGRANKNNASTHHEVLEDLVKEGRSLIREGDLVKVCRKRNKKFHFWLFNDLFIYGHAVRIGVVEKDLSRKWKVASHGKSDREMHELFQRHLTDGNAALSKDQFKAAVEQDILKKVRSFGCR